MIDLHSVTRPETGVIQRPIAGIEAGKPAFREGLAYNAPARGHWTIAHTPLLIPGSQMIYLCASACMRGVVLSCLEDDGMDRFSMILLDDRDICEGNLEQMMLDGICSVIDGLPERPPLIMPFTSCIHHFLACDQNYIYRKLRRRYPDIDFAQGYMIPTIRKGHITPEEMVWITMTDAWKEQPTKARAVNWIGSNFAQDPANDCCALLDAAGFVRHDAADLASYAEYQAMGASGFNLHSLPVAGAACRSLAKRLGQKEIYLPCTCDSEEIRQELRHLAEELGIIWNSELEAQVDEAEAEAERALVRAHEVIGEAPIAIDHEVMPRICSLARLLITHGFHVEEIYADRILPEDAEDLRWLQENAPNLTLCAVTSYACRMAPRTAAEHAGGKLLAIGQKAAYFTGTRHFVNILEGGGLWGFHGIQVLADRMAEAFRHESSVPEIISVKAWGCSGTEHACP